VKRKLTKDEILDFLKRMKPSYYESFSLTKLGLIGSFSRNEATPKSDIDLIVSFKPGTKNLIDRTERLRKSVRRKFGRNVDISPEKFIRPYFKKNILRDAIFI
jgi:uncharacterized protein